MNTRSDFLFQFLNQVTFVKDKEFMSKASEEDRKSINSFIINKWISQDPNLIVIADYLNPLIFNLTVDQLYKIYCRIIPKRKMFFKWIGGKKQKQKTVPDFALNLIKREFEISQKEALDYFDLFQKNNTLKLLVRKYALEDEQLKQLGLNREQLYNNSKLQIKELVNMTLNVKEEKKDNWGEDLFDD